MKCQYCPLCPAIRAGVGTLNATEYFRIGKQAMLKATQHVLTELTTVLSALRKVYPAWVIVRQHSSYGYLIRA